MSVAEVDSKPAAAVRSGGGDAGSDALALASRVELGCLLGAFRDVAFSIGFQVLGVTLRARGADTGVDGATGGRGAVGMPKGRSRRELKLIALVQTFADNAALEGFVLENIDLKPVPEKERQAAADCKDWSVKVEIKRLPEGNAAGNKERPA